MLLIISKLLGPLLAVCIGIYSRRRFNFFFRFLFFQVVVWIGFYALSKGVLTYQKMNHLELNNQWLFNISLPFEAFFLFAAVFFYFKNRHAKTLITLAFGLFVVAFVSEIFVKGFANYCNYADSVEGILLVILYGVILYVEFDASRQQWYSSAVIWVCLGLFIYFAGGIPYISLFEYLQHKNMSSNKFLFQIINGILANIRYLLLSLGFWVISSDKHKHFT